MVKILLCTSLWLLLAALDLFGQAFTLRDVAFVGNSTPAATGAANTLTNGLVAYWNLDEVGGNRADSWGTNNLQTNGTFGNVPGKLTSAANISNNGRWLSQPDNADLSVGASSFTFSTWVNVTNAPGAGAGRNVISKYNYTLSQREYALSWEKATDTFAFNVSSNGTGTVGVSATGTPVTNTWYHVVSWYSTNYNSIYIQVNGGTVYSNAAPNGVLDGTSDFQLGRLHDNTAWSLLGYVDDTMFWKRKLTVAERSQLYNSGNGLANPLQ